MKIEVKLSIVNEKGDPFMGIGIVWLLQRIRSFGSIKKAAEDMNMSYAKAHRILNTCEEELGKKLLIKSIGGNKRGGARLTDFAEYFIENYTVFQEHVKEFAEREFKKFHADIGD
jgi:molybdate transport system regulatory protein